MPMQTYTLSPQRIGKFKGDIIKHANHVEVLGITGVQKKIPKNSGDTVVWRRWLPKGASVGAIANGIDPQNRIITAANVDTYANSHRTSEGVTPSAITLTPVDVEAALQEYAVLFSVTNKAVDMYEDDVPAEMKRQTGETVGLIREMCRYGQLKGATNVFYAGGTSRNTVSKTLDLNLLRNVARSLLSNNAKQITEILAPSGNFNTTPVEAGFLVFCSTDMEPAIRDIPGFKSVAEYGQRKPIHANEIGSVERFRFVLASQLAQYADSGAAIGATGLYSTTGVNIDVYPVIVVAEDAWGQVALRGLDAVTPTWLPPGQKSKSDPLGQRGYVGAMFYFATALLNQGWLTVVECGTPNLA